MTPLQWISNFTNEMKGERINPFIFALMMGNKYKSPVYVLVDEFTIIDAICKVGETFYAPEGVVEPDDVSDYILFDKLSVLHHTEGYNDVKWYFIINEKEHEE